MAKLGYLGVTYQTLEVKGQKRIVGWGCNIHVYALEDMENFLNSMMELATPDPYRYVDKWDTPLEGN